MRSVKALGSGAGQTFSADCQSKREERELVREAAP